MNFKLLPTVFTVIYFSLFFSQESVAAGTCIDVYKSRPKGYLVAPERASSQSEIALWPRPENAVLGNKSNEVAHLLAQESARQQYNGTSKVYRPELIERELYTPSTAPDIRRLYLAHKLLLGDLIKSDLYADAVMNVLAEDKIDTPEEIKRFVDNFNGWKSLNANASDSFLSRSARDFALKLESYVGDSVDYVKLDEARVKYGLSAEDLIQLKSNLAMLRENNDGNLKLSIMLPILADGPSTIKLLEQALDRRKAANNLVVVPVKSTALAVPSPKGGLAWHLKSLRNLGKKVFNTGQLRFGKLSVDRNEQLLLKAESIFSSARSEFSVDPNFLKEIFVNKENPKSYALSEMIALIKKAPGYFFIALDGKNRGYTAIETNIRILNFIKALPQIRLNTSHFRPVDFIVLQDNLESLKNLVSQVAKVFTEEKLTLDSNIITEVLKGDSKLQNEGWEKEVILKISEVQKQFTETYVKTKEREGSPDFSPAEAEVINKTRSNSRLVELFDSSTRDGSMIDPLGFSKVLFEIKLSTEDVTYLLKNYNADRFHNNWNINILFAQAGFLPVGVVDQSARAMAIDLNTIFAGRLAASFDSRTQKMTLDQFSVIFDKFQQLGVTETIFGKAALVKFFKLLVGATPSEYEKSILDLNSAEVNLMLDKHKYQSYLQYLELVFNLTTDYKKASDPSSPETLLDGKGTFTILNWIKSAYLRRNRGY